MGGFNLETVTETLFKISISSNDLSIILLTTASSSLDLVNISLFAILAKST